MNSSKAISAAQFVFCLLMLLVSFYFEYFVGLTPCPLCVMQRMLVTFLLMISLVNWALNAYPKAKFYTTVISIIGCNVGIALAARHTWMQLNSELFVSSTCLPNIGYMLKMFSLADTLTAIIKHGGFDCANPQWIMLGIPMPGWLFIGYLVLLITYIYSAVQSRS